MQQVLYRFFDDSGVLLYVGISRHWTSRLNSHESRSEFFKLASHITLERYGTRAEVEQAETAAIVNEKPLYNRSQNPLHESWLDHFLRLKRSYYKGDAIDNSHRALLDDIANYVEPLKQGRKLPPAKSLALGFVELYLSSNLVNECELCDDIYLKRQLHLWAEDVRELLCR
jgi:hypothetical protein